MSVGPSGSQLLVPGGQPPLTLAPSVKTNTMKTWTLTLTVFKKNKTKKKDDNTAGKA